MKFTKEKFWRSTRDYFFITFGMALYAFGFCAFILPQGVVIGGLAGIGSIVYYTLGVPVAVTQYALNLLLLACAWHVVGKRFVLGTIYGVTMISLFVGLFQPLFTEPLTSEPFMNVIIGSLFIGFGIGLTFIHNGSSGGTDIVAAMVSKHSNVSIGRMMLYVDVFTISSSFLIFHEIDRVVYGFVVLAILSLLTDMIINTNRQAVQFTIISPHWQEIADAVITDARRGCTVLDGMGWYTKKDVKVLLVMCRKIESVTVFRIIKSIDRHAFITQCNVNGVYGQGFEEVKIRLRAQDKERRSREKELLEEKPQ